MKLSRLSIIGACAVAALVVAGCSSASSQTTSSQTTASGQTPSSGVTAPGTATAKYTVKIGVVPGPDIGLLYVPAVKKMFQSHGVNVEITNVQGPQVITGVISGQFDLAYAAYTPPLLAVAAGTDLRVVSGLSVYGPAGHNGATLVKKDSGINSWADLAGKRVGTPSPKSLSALTLQAAIVKDGGNPADKVQIVPLPQTQVARALEQGQVQVGDLVEPFAAEALAKYSDFKDIGDSKAYVLGEGGPFTGFFTTAQKEASEAAAFSAFKAALDEAVPYGNAHPDEVHIAGAPQAGLSTKVALTLPNSVYNSTVTASSLKPLVDAMVQMGWIKSAPDLNKFVG